jgi:arylsulfatase A-like enzyme
MAAFGGWRFARASAPVNGPIILISIDALRADHLPAYGYPNVRTPAIDALATDGVVFERAYSNVPQTLPAHAALLTGRLPFETGVRDGIGFTVKSSERLLPEMLGDRGFTTGGFVSSYLLRKDTGIGQGFMVFDADLPEKGDRVLADALRRDGTDSERIAENWLASAGTDRVFLFLHLDEPRAAAAGGPDTDQHGPYDLAIADVDRTVGRLTRYLKAHQLYDRSTIVLLSDHGQGLGDHGEGTHGLFVYEEGLRVPLIVKQPAGEGAGRRVSALVQLVDIVPTILDLAKAPNPGNLSGRSLKPLLDGEDDFAARPIYAESLYGAYHFGWAELRSVTDGQYRYIDAPQPELYDLVADPAQRENLILTHSQIATTLRAALSTFASSRPVHAAGPVPASERERLEALGYVGVHLDAGSTVRPLEQADPKDKHVILEQYRAAVAVAASSEWLPSLQQFRTLARTEPSLIDVWVHLAAVATRAERHDLALEASKEAMELHPADPAITLAAATASLRLRKLEEARQYAALVVATQSADKEWRSAAHALLARVALARHESDGALAEAALAEDADPTRPVRAYVEGRLAHEQGRYVAAAESFELALSAVETSAGPPLGDLRFYTADTLLRLGRFSEAEYLFLEELKAAPLNARTRAGLAAVYRATGRSDEAAAALAGH